MIMENKDKFISLMMIFGQLKILKTIIKRMDLNYDKLEKLEDNYFN